MILNIIKKSFKEVNSNPAITLLFVSFLILTSIFTPYIFILQNKIYGIIIIFLIFFLACIFFGGWFQIFNEIQKNIKRSLVGIFFEGAGKNIVSSIILFLTYIFLFILVSFVAIQISMKIFGDPSFIMNDIAVAAQDKNTYLDYINNLSSDKMFIIYGWQFAFVIFYSIFNFLFLFLPATFIKTEAKNAFLRPFLAMGENFKFIFKNFLFSILVYFLICLGFMIMGILRAVTSVNSILSVVHLFVYIYFISYVVMIIFNCYEEKNSYLDRTDSIGEDESINSTGEEL